MTSRGVRVQRVRVAYASNAGKDVESLVNEMKRGSGADPGGRTRDDDESSVRLEARHLSLQAPPMPLRGPP
jgi:hypothetical protein